MKRDMELVRRILFALENEEFEGENYEDKCFDDVDKDIFYHHVKIMDQAGLLECSKYNPGDMMPMRYFPEDLTWQGHEFLDSVRQSDVWSKLKEKLGKDLSSLPLAAISTVSIEMMKQWALNKLGLNPTP